MDIGGVSIQIMIPGLPGSVELLMFLSWAQDAVFCLAPGSPGPMEGCVILSWDLYAETFLVSQSTRWCH
jgi:hypothetical protein